jgi:DNA repair exonuclease SbcCD ATPase subunit
MVIFKFVRWKNFLSTGNSFTEIELNSHQNSLHFGKNGSGKSTFLDALVFGLFGKAFRNINKPALVNSINGKNCLVEIEFNIDTKTYKVVRGIKPTVFEIYCDGEMINQDSESKDYQALLEQQILKFNYKTFTQVVVLGSASYVPFMQLPLASRREVIEDLLDIRIFSLMNTILKDKVAKTKDDISSIDSAINLAKERVESQKKLISVLESNDAEKRSIIEKTIEDIKSYISANDDEIATNQEILDVEFDNISDSLAEVNSKISDMRASISANDKQIKVLKGQVSFFNSNDICPTCKQDINESHKIHILEEVTSDITNHSTSNIELSDKISASEKTSSELSAEYKKLTEMQTRNKHLRTENKKHKAKIDDLTETLNQFCDNRIVEEKEKLKDIAKVAFESLKKKEFLVDLKQVQEMVSVLLKDGGIKTTIIREYLPIFNRLINKYLSIMDLYVDFRLDETFNESMKSRYRDNFTYDSFSEGEKQRIDLALLFTFREVAKLKNSLTTNLLVLDEVFDSSLDVAGVEYVMQLLNEFKNTNTFIISHNVNLISSSCFDNTVQFEKRGDFSVKVEGKSKFTA